jgi:hypothetical protein
MLLERDDSRLSETGSSPQPQEVLKSAFSPITSSCPTVCRRPTCHPLASPTPAPLDPTIAPCLRCTLPELPCLNLATTSPIVPHWTELTLERHPCNYVRHCYGFVGFVGDVETPANVPMIREMSSTFSALFELMASLEEGLDGGGYAGSNGHVAAERRQGVAACCGTALCGGCFHPTQEKCDIESFCQ